jgi:DNA-binding XRE family transcriptional regulator
MSSDTTSRPQRVPKRKASVYADALFEVKKAQLAQSLVRLRISQGLSQEALAYEAEVERSYVSLIERGQSNPSLRVLCQLAQRLGVSVMTLLGEAEPLDRMPDTGSTALVLHDPGRSMVFEKTGPTTLAEAPAPP